MKFYMRPATWESCGNDCRWNGTSGVGCPNKGCEGQIVSDSEERIDPKEWNQMIISVTERPVDRLKIKDLLFLVKHGEETEVDDYVGVISRKAFDQLKEIYERTK